MKLKFDAKKRVVIMGTIKMIKSVNGYDPTEEEVIDYLKGEDIDLQLKFLREHGYIG